MFKKEYIYLNLEVDGEIQQYLIEEGQFRQAIKNAIAAGIDEFSIILDEKNDIKFPLSVESAKQILRIENMKKNIIPSKLNGYLVDVNHQVLTNPRPAIEGRDEEIEKVWFYLSQHTRNNAILTGETEVGKTTIALDIVRKIVYNEAPKKFLNKRVIMLNPGEYLKAQSLYSDDDNNNKYTKLLDKTVEFLQNNRKRIIIYIDDMIHMFFDDYLYSLLEDIITKFGIPTIMTIKDEHFEAIVKDNIFLEKYVNEIYVEEPEVTDLWSMLNRHVEGLKKKYNIEISNEMVEFIVYTAVLTNSISVNPGNTVNVLRMAFSYAALKGKKAIDKECVLSCYNLRLKDYKDKTKEEIRATAYHEVGHYIVFKMCKNLKDFKMRFVSILPSMDFGGVNWPYSSKGEETTILSRDYFIDQIAFSLGGRIGELRVTENYTFGAISDLEQSNEMARAISMKFGLSDNSNNKNRHYDYEDYYLLPESKKQQLDEERQKIIDEAYERAEKIIEENEELLRIISEKLIEKEILTGKELNEICDSYMNRKALEDSDSEKKILNN